MSNMAAPPAPALHADKQVAAAPSSGAAPAAVQQTPMPARTAPSSAATSPGPSSAPPTPGPSPAKSFAAVAAEPASDAVTKAIVKHVSALRENYDKKPDANKSMFTYYTKLTSLETLQNTLQETSEIDGHYMSPLGMPALEPICSEMCDRVARLQWGEQQYSTFERKGWLCCKEKKTKSVFLVRVYFEKYKSVNRVWALCMDLQTDSDAVHKSLTAAFRTNPPTTDDSSSTSTPAKAKLSSKKQH
jgi:hypothetical protein